LTESPAPPDSAARPAPNENYLLINAYTTHPASPLLAVSRRIADSGCNLVDTRLSTVGRDVSVSALAIGSWDAVAKLEAMLTRLEREEGLKLIWYRTGPKPIQSNLLPYIVEVVASDKPGILFQLADFFDRQGITIESLHCSRYRAMQTGADMFSAMGENHQRCRTRTRFWAGESRSTCSYWIRRIRRRWHSRPLYIGGNALQRRWRSPEWQQHCCFSRI
jgi:glycine cleavage system transcriptional repressor